MGAEKDIVSVFIVATISTVTLLIAGTITLTVVSTDLLVLAEPEVPQVTDSLKDRPILKTPSSDTELESVIPAVIDVDQLVLCCQFPLTVKEIVAGVLLLL
jgi:hypothetical protein